jgi:hypothetical protein
LNIGSNRSGSVSSTPTINDDASAPIATPTSTQPRLRLKRPRIEVDDDVIITNGNGH